MTDDMIVAMVSLDTPGNVGAFENEDYRITNLIGVAVGRRTKLYP